MSAPPGGEPSIIGSRVIVIAILPGGQEIYGTVLVNSQDTCSTATIIDEAVAQVAAGLWASGGRGTGVASPQIAYIEQTVDGGFAHGTYPILC